MAIYGIGAYYNQDISKIFIKHKIIGTGWSNEEAPELHAYIKAIKAGDIVYIKSFSPSAIYMTIKAIGIIKDAEIIEPIKINTIEVKIGRNVVWVYSKEDIKLKKPEEKNNVRNNIIYEEFHPLIQEKIIDILKGVVNRNCRKCPNGT